METKLREVFARIFHMPADADFESQVRRGVGAWDSLRHMQLMTAIETRFGLILTLEDVSEIRSFESALRALKIYPVHQ
jgi:acyl carrier protein